MRYLTKCLITLKLIDLGRSHMLNSLIDLEISLEKTHHHQSHQITRTKKITAKSNTIKMMYGRVKSEMANQEEKAVLSIKKPIALKKVLK